MTRPAHATRARGAPRICSLLPGATEVVAALGMADHLVGVSHECDHPPEIRGTPVLVRASVDSEGLDSGAIDRAVRERLARGEPLYQLDEARFLEARPDVVLTQELCQVCAVTPGQLEQAIGALPTRPATLTLHPLTLEQVLDDITRIGAVLGREPEARAFQAGLRRRLSQVRDRAASASTRPRVACLDWVDPFYCAGHWIPEMVDLAGGQDVLGRRDEPSRPITWDELVEAAPEVVVLMPCGFSAERAQRELEPVLRRHDWTRLPAARDGRLVAVDASSYFSRPGPRLVDGVALLASLLHPTRFGETSPPGARPVILRTTACSREGMR